jgi:gluconate 5-dehydrogenase
MDLFSLEGKVAFVTGSSRGLGLAIAEGLGKAGAKIVLNGRGIDRLEKARQSLKTKGIEVSAYSFDVTREQEVLESVKKIEKEAGPIDILVNNAGMILRAPIEDFETNKWHELMNLNLNAVFYVSKVVGKRMIARKCGKIINIASLLSEAARPSVAPYAVSKGAIKMFTKAMAVEWAKYNIQVNAIGPGFFATELSEALRKDKKINTWICEGTPAGRWGEPFELVGAAVFFASSASDFVTGQVLYVDGGWLAAL